MITLVENMAVTCILIIFHRSKKENDCVISIISSKQYLEICRKWLKNSFKKLDGHDFRSREAVVDA